MTERDGRHVVRAHSVNLPSDRPARTFGTGRVCRHEDCDTVLSMYNESRFCSLHKPFERWNHGASPGRKAVA